MILALAEHVQYTDMNNRIKLDQQSRQCRWIQSVSPDDPALFRSVVDI